MTFHLPRIPFERYGRFFTGFTYSFLAYVTAIVFVALLGAKYLEYRELQAIDGRLYTAALSLKYMLAQDFHDRAIDVDSISFDEELKNRAAISNFAKETGFIYAYTLVEKEGSYFFSAPTVTEEEAEEQERWYFYPYEDIPDSFKLAMEDGLTTYSTYSDQWGTFRSVAVPEQSPGGVRYLSCVDMDISYIQRERMQNFLLAGGVGILLILSSLPLLLIYRRSQRAYTRKLLKVNADLEVAYDRVKKLDQLKSSLLTKVSHELRTPLTSIQGFVKLVAKSFDRSFAPLINLHPELADDHVRIQSNLGIVLRESQRIIRLITDSLDLSKIEANKMTWCDDSASPEMIANVAVDAIKGLVLENKALQLKTNIQPGLPDICVDQDKIHQVLVNILGNAIKFTEQGDVSLKVSQVGGRIVFAVSDTGIGIGTEDLQHIFDEFYQAVHRDTVKDARKGTGFGLALCRQIVEHYGGQILVESECGKGSTFIVELPVVDG